MIVTIPGPATMTVVPAADGRPAHYADQIRCHIPDDVDLSRLVDLAGGSIDSALAIYAEDGTLIQVQTVGALVTVKGRRHATRTGASAYRRATPVEAALAIAAAREQAAARVEAARVRWGSAMANAAADNAILDKIAALLDAQEG